MRFLLDQPFGAWDLETTGVNVETARIVTACTAVLEPGDPKWQTLITTLMIAVEEEIPAEATAVHGITTEFARQHGQPPAEVIDELLTEQLRWMHLGYPIVGMNSSYDFTVLDREAQRCYERWPDYGWTPQPVIDVYVIDKWLDPFRSGSRKLTDLAKFYAVDSGTAHDATSDTMAAARIAYRIASLSSRTFEEICRWFRELGRRQPEQIAERYRNLGQMDAASLHANQIHWRAQQQASLADYKRRKGEGGDFSPHWPIQPRPEPKEGSP